MVDCSAVLLVVFWSTDPKFFFPSNFSLSAIRQKITSSYNGHPTHETHPNQFLIVPVSPRSFFVDFFCLNSTQILQSEFFLGGLQQNKSWLHTRDCESQKVNTRCSTGFSFLYLFLLNSFICFLHFINQKILLILCIF